MLFKRLGSGPHCEIPFGPTANKSLTESVILITQRGMACCVFRWWTALDKFHIFAINMELVL